MADEHVRRVVVVVVARVALVADLGEENDVIARVGRVRQLVATREEDVVFHDSPLAVQSDVLLRETVVEH